MKKELEDIFLQGLEQNKHKLFRICSVYSVNPEDSKDLFQEVVVHIWKSIATFKSESSIDTWMYRITLNVCLRINSLQQKNHALFKRVNKSLLENISIEIEEEENLQLRYLRSCIKKLNEGDKSVITLYLESLSYKDISIITGLTENHIAVKIKRIKSKLFNCIKQMS